MLRACLLQSDARVPLIVADPRFPKLHGRRTPSFAELLDVFPTLVELAGLPEPVALVPPISGRSFARLVREQARQSPLHRKFAVTQFSRCPITASEYLRDIQGKGPMIMVPQVSIDYRTRPDRGSAVGGWECAWKGKVTCLFSFLKGLPRFIHLLVVRFHLYERLGMGRASRPRVDGLFYSKRRMALQCLVSLGLEHYESGLDIPSLWRGALRSQNGCRRGNQIGIEKCALHELTLRLVAVISV